MLFSKKAPDLDDDWQARRHRMLEQVRAYGISDPAVLAALGRVNRQAFIPDAHLNRADVYGDHPCPIGCGQTISQPYMVAYMTERLALRSGERVLEIGTGSGYQSAVLAELGAEVYTIETVAALAEHARRALAAEGYARVHVRCGDGHAGWPEEAPFHAVIVTCAPEDVPAPLTEQLMDDGRMILPVGVAMQRLVLLRKCAGRLQREDDLQVRFVPMIRNRRAEP